MESDPPPFVRHGPAEPVTPIVVAVPHAGRFYPPAIERDREVDQAVLEQLEDRYADRLISEVIAGGAVALVATHARAWIDLNRSEADGVGPGVGAASARARAGLGLVPSRLAGRALWRSAPSVDEEQRRLRTVHAPYHLAIAAALSQAWARHGAALLIDCHSMPPLDRSGARPARIVIGDLHGRSAAPAVTSAAIAAAALNGLVAGRNVPYAGAYTLSRHGRPEAGIHAFQVEVDRSLYLAPGLRDLSASTPAIAALLARICWAAATAINPPLDLAAE